MYLDLYIIVQTKVKQIQNKREQDISIKHHLLEFRIMINSRVFLLVSMEMARDTSNSIFWIESEVYCWSTNGATAWTWCCKDEVSSLPISTIRWFRNDFIYTWILIKLNIYHNHILMHNKCWRNWKYRSWPLPKQFQRNVYHQEQDQDQEQYCTQRWELKEGNFYSIYELKFLYAEMN